MKNWDVGDWFICAVTGALAVLCITIAIILSVSAEHAEKAACRRNGGTIQIIPGTPSEWNCFKPSCVEHAP